MPKADEAAVLALYRSLPAHQRRETTAASTPQLRAQLVRVERELTMDRSPGAMASVLTEGREMQAPHLAKIDAAFERVAAGKPTKLPLTMPPRHGKSRRAARWAPLWYLRRRPEHRVMIASYSSDLADDHGRWIRDAILNYSPQLGISLRPGSSAANRFDLAGTEGGAVMAGVGGGLTGKGAHLAVVDDPIKDAAEASSPTMRKRLWEWWQAVLLTRIEPGGSVILIQTRWDEDDLAGRVLADEGDRWTVIDLPALALSHDDALGRPVGAPLWPERYDHDALTEIRRSVGERVWWSLYMQQPRPQDGGVWEWAWITNNRTAQPSSEASTSLASSSPSTRGRRVRSLRRDRHRRRRHRPRRAPLRPGRPLRKPRGRMREGVRRACSRSSCGQTRSSWSPTTAATCRSRSSTRHGKNCAGRSARRTC
ncbi:terminase large subunit domain-containing protein [Streptomyces sp. NPDC087440]|uniref:terminase large subunit domain-containing protein n=1 Tax=Streptomyces sp. NPDC087440 TaxID=3365790 RepID=UPI0037F7A802